MVDRNERVKRLFIAVDLNEETRAQIASITVRLKADTPDVRITWVHPDRLHLTLEFLGNADAGIEQKAMAALAQPIPLAPFDLVFNGLGWFPPRGSPRVLWLGITQGLAELGQLHRVIRQRLGARSGAGEPFHPHLTLARFRDRVARTDLAKLSKIPASAGPCGIDRVTLYESRLSPKGPTYSALAEAGLQLRA
jgi:2'-5' RNA ligase